MRPALHLLLSGLSGKVDQINYNIAAILELIHTATLLHDDVVDQSTKRRNINSANTVFGNSASVLVGDFIYSRSDKTNNHRIDENDSLVYHSF